MLLGVCDSQVWEGRRGDASLVLSVRVCRALRPPSRGGKARGDGARGRRGHVSALSRRSVIEGSLLRVKVSLLD